MRTRGACGGAHHRSNGLINLTFYTARAVHTAAETAAFGFFERERR
jgi:hypothetical protein